MYEYTPLKKPASVRKAEKNIPNTSTQREKYQSILQTLQNICVKFEKVLDYQNKKLVNIETKFSQVLISRFDKLIDINSSINENMQKILSNNNNFNISRKSSESHDKFIPIISNIKLTGNQDFITNNKIVNKKKIRKSKPLRLLSQIKSKQINLSDFEQNPFPQTPVPQHQNISIVQKYNNTIQLTSFQKLKGAILNHKNQPQINKIFSNWIRDFYIKNAQICFEQYSSKKIIFEDMKINFSTNIMKEVLNLFKFYNTEKQFKGCRQMQAKAKFIADFDKQSRNILDFLIKKYPPSRRRILDSELSEKIIEFNKTSNPKYDMLLNADIDMEASIQKTDYTKNIKILLNKLISQTKKQYPIFKHKMKQIFTGKENGSLTENAQHQVQYLIGSKIKDGTPLYTQQELQYPGLKLKAPELLRILLKWMDQLKSYIISSDSKIKNNKYGFKSTKKGEFIILNRDKKQLICQKLNQINITELKIYRQEVKKNITSLITELFMIVSQGFEGFQFLDQNEVTIAKLSQYFNDGTETMTLFILNKMIHNLAAIAQEKLLCFQSEDNQISQKLDFVTFNVLDLLRCKCTGSKTEIFRIYNKILQNKDYFQIIRVKNKLNQVTRDILINLKLKKSFLICQVQLSLGQQQQQVNDHFCHYLYELSRSSFHILFQCSNQLVNIDPKMAYFTPDKKIEFKNSLPIKSFCEQYLIIKNDELSCRYGHQDNLMKYHLNNLPFSCSICLTFVSGNTFSTQYLKCNLCQLSICPPCISQSKFKEGCELIRENYIYRYLKIEALTEFLQTRPFFMQFCDQKTLKNKINEALTLKKYIFVVRFDSKGLKYNIVKKYRNQVIDSFYTIDGIKKDHIQLNPVPNLNGIFLPKNIQLKKLKQLEHHKKFHIKQNWFQLEQILDGKKIDEVICMISQIKKTVLIIDIIQTQQEITHYMLKKQVKNIVAQQNKLGFGQLELTCKHIDNLGQINQIKFKQKIKNINLFDNKIIDLSGLKEFKNIKSLDLRSNRINDINILLQLKQLQILILKNNNLSDRLPALNFPSLKNLDISFNNITEIGLIELPCIINLTLSQNKLVNLPIIKAHNLQILMFQKNKINNINNLIKSQIPSIKRINGKNNQIETELPELHFYKLQFFNLSFNRITCISNLQKSELTQIQSINLFSNNISTDFPQLKAMKMIRLNLSNNKIKNIKKLQVSKLQEISQLQFQNNLIQGKLPCLNFKKLKVLNMKTNKLTNIDMIQKSYIPLIQKIDLSQNLIQSHFPVLKLKKLKAIDLSLNAIHNIDKLENCKLPRVTHIKLNHNKICKQVPVLNFEELVSLELNDNSIQQLCCLREIHLVPKLKRIGLEGNKIRIGQNLQITRDSTQQKYDYQTNGICYLWSRPIINNQII